MISAAKLVATDAVPKEYLGPEIISHFVMHGTKVGEIVNNLISELRVKDDVSYIFLEAMKRVSDRLKGDRIVFFLFILVLLFIDLFK